MDGFILHIYLYCICSYTFFCSSDMCFPACDQVLSYSNFNLLLILSCFIKGHHLKAQNVYPNSSSLLNVCVIVCKAFCCLHHRQKEQHCREVITPSRATRATSARQLGHWLSVSGGGQNWSTNTGCPTLQIHCSSQEQRG